jgi:hypothetical protein
LERVDATGEALDELFSEGVVGRCIVGAARPGDPDSGEYITLTRGR